MIGAVNVMQEHGDRSVSRPSTLKDVARVAGVSTSTTSRALLDQAGVSAEKRRKVLAASKQLGFVHNQLARALKHELPRTLGLLLRHSSTPFYAHLASALDREVADRGYEVFSTATHDKPKSGNSRSLSMLVGLRTSGIIVATPLVDPQTIASIQRQVPLVLVGQGGQSENPTLPFVAADPIQGIEMIDHLVSLGHRSFGIFANPSSVSPARWPRISIMLNELRRRNLEVQHVERRDDLRIGEMICSMHRAGITAVIADEDSAAWDILAAARDQGLDVPGDISVTGYDGVPPYDHPLIGLTTCYIPIQGMAAHAVDIVDRLIEGRPVDTSGVVLRGRLVIGRTSGPVSIK